MKKYQVITLIFFAWMLLTTSQVQRELYSQVSQAWQQHIQYQTQVISEAEEDPPCDQTSVIAIKQSAVHLLMDPVCRLLK